MGQLEKYGLYVLCLVIFLILGVAIWGGDPASLPAKGPLEAGHLAANKSEKPKPEVSLPDLLNPRPADKVEPKPAEKPPAAGGPVVPGPIVTPPPAPPAAEHYTVQKGDTFESIATRILGSRSHRDALMAANPGIPADRLIPGRTKLVLPATAKEAARPAPTQTGSPAPEKPKDALLGSGSGNPGEKKIEAAPVPKAASTTYRVQKGDSLVAISRKVFRDDRHVDAIFALNRDKLRSKHDLPRNLDLKLPAQ